jgi:hypothetical protein
MELFTCYDSDRLDTQSGRFNLELETCILPIDIRQAVVAMFCHNRPLYGQKR